MTSEQRIAYLASISHRADPATTVTGIARRIAEGTGISYDAIMGRPRDAVVSEARQVVMFEAHEAGISYSAIGRALGRNHATVISGVKREAERRGIAPEAPTVKPRKSSRKPRGVMLDRDQLADYRHLVSTKHMRRDEALQIMGVKQ